MIAQIDEVLWIPEYLFNDKFLQEITIHYPNETGGMLLGYVNGHHRVVTHAIGAGPNAIHKPFRLVPDDKFQQVQLLEHFENTNGRESFLGEWHSHPNSTPEMSQTDRRTLNQVTLGSNNLPALPVMMIIGFNSKRSAHQIRAYIYNSKSNHVWLREKHFAEIRVNVHNKLK